MNDIFLFLEVARQAAPNTPAPSTRMVPEPTACGTRMSLKVLGDKDWTDQSMHVIEQIRLQAQGAKLSFDEHGDETGHHQWPNWSNFLREFTRTRPGLLVRIHLIGVSFFFYHKGLVTSSEYDPEYNGSLHASTDRPWRG